MGFFDIFSSKNDNKEKIEDFMNMKDTHQTDYITNSGIMSGVRKDNNIVTIGDIITMPIDSDDDRVRRTFNNAKPQYLNQIYKLVPMHSRIIKNITEELLSDLVFDYKKSVENDIKFKKFLQQTIKKSDDFDQFEDWLELIIEDFLVNGNVYIKESRKDGVVIKYEHLLSERVRIRGDKNTLVKTGYAYNVDWINSNNYYKYDCYDKNLAMGEHILHFALKTPDFKFYGEPDYISAIHWLENSSNIPDFYKQQLINGVYPSVVMTFYEYPNTPEAQSSFKRTLMSLGGKRGNGKILTLLGKNPDLAPKVDKIDAGNMDKMFKSIQDDIGREICYSWGIDPATMGMVTPNGLGNKNVVEEQTEKFEERLNSYRKKVVKIIQTMLDNADLDFIKIKYKK